MRGISIRAAKKAEKAFQFELGNKNGFVSPEIWDSSRKGLLAGQRLMVQLRQMDAAFIENNKREMEITKAVSLRLLDPASLLELQETGTCHIKLPELLYDFDFPGQYFRRIKSVRITIPCITGPYTNVNARLKLTKSKIRTSTELVNGGEYAIEDSGNPDDRFLVNPIPIMTIATSNAQLDSGMFEFNFRDERYLPFEGAGADSEWELELPKDYRQFDYRTISDVVLHVSYTAREATSPAFVQAVKEYLASYIKSIGNFPNLISLKQSFPDQFEAIVAGGNSTGTIALDDKFLPNLIADYKKRENVTCKMRNISVFLLTKSPVTLGAPPLKIQIGAKQDNGVANKLYDGYVYQITFGNLDPDSEGFPLGECVFSGFNGALKDSIDDMYLYFEYPSTEENDA